MTPTDDTTRPSHDADGADSVGAVGGAPSQDAVAARRATRQDTEPEDAVVARHRSETGDTNVNEPDLEDRRGEREEGRPVRITVNEVFAQEVGAQGVRAYIDALVRIGEGARGQRAGEVSEQLVDAWSSAGVLVDPLEAGKIAEKVADPTRGRLIIVDSENNELYGHDVTRGGQRSARQDEPADPDRPAWT